MALKHIKELVEERSKNSNFFLLERVRNRWPEIIGTVLASKSYPIFIKDKKLKIAAENSAWITQLNFLKNTIKDKINTAFNDFIVDKIDFVIDVGSKTNQFVEKESAALEFSTKDIVLKKEDILKIKTIVKGISDVDLKEPMYHMLSNGFKRIKKLRSEGLIRCKNCGAFTLETDKMCVECKHILEKENIVRVRRLIKKNPVLTFLEAKKEINSLKSIEFLKIKEQLLEQWRVQIERSKVHDKIFETILVRYFMLKYETESKMVIADKIKLFKLEQEEKKKKDGGIESGRVFSK
ncbi:MAG: DUF721 domain-containing protein [Fusobacteria bacterium]|nr:DUF721 domain-containing protein [Fusobacteriota bacterium]